MLQLSTKTRINISNVRFGTNDSGIVWLRSQRSVRTQRAIRICYGHSLSPAIAYPITASIPKSAPRIAARKVSLPLFSAIR